MDRWHSSDEELFAAVYHKMVHSTGLEIILLREHMYAQTVRQRCDSKDTQLKILSNRYVK